MKGSKKTINVAEISRQLAKGKMVFNILLQRGYVWNTDRKSLFIESIITDFSIDPVSINMSNGVAEIIDGKQRLSTVNDFKLGLFKLHKNTSPIINEAGDELDIAGCSYEQLPEEVRNKIDAFTFDAYYYENLSSREKMNFMVRKNSGVQMSKQDLARMQIRSREDFVAIAMLPAISVSLTEKSKRKLVDEDIAMHLWCVCFAEDKTLAPAKLLKLLRETEITSEQKESLIEAVEKLGRFLLSQGGNKELAKKLKKKTHLMYASYMAFEANNAGMSDDDFSEKILNFFTTGGKKGTVSEAYNAAVLVSSNKASNVVTAMAEVQKALG